MHKKGKNGAMILLVIVVWAAIYFFSTSERRWLSEHEKEICTAGVAFKNRWGYEGQAENGQYANHTNGIYLFRSANHKSLIRCKVVDNRILTSWTKTFPTNPTTSHLFYKTNDFSGIHIMEFIKTEITGEATYEFKVNGEVARVSE